MSTPENQSYLSAGINKLSPWSPRTQSPKPAATPPGKDLSGLGLKPPQRGGDHKISHKRGLSQKSYPQDCPPLAVQWFHAVDIPKRKPNLAGGSSEETQKPKIAPKKYAAFSKNDSRAIEGAFQKLTEEGEPNEQRLLVRDVEGDGDLGQTVKADYETPSEIGTKQEGPNTIKVPVNEDYLFDVDIEGRELAPAYWLGPVYEAYNIISSSFVDKGTDSTTQRPCDENLATQLEEGFLKIAPWRFPQPRSASQPRSRTASLENGPDNATTDKSLSPTLVAPKASSPDLRQQSKDATNKTAKIPETTNANTHRLFGPYSNSVVTYQDANTAWILSDDFYSRMSSSVYGRFAGGGHLAGMRVTRGYVDLSKKPDARARSKERAANVSIKVDTPEPTAGEMQASEELPTSPTSETKRRNLERHMSSLVASTSQADPETQEEEVRKRDEKEIQDDYQDQEGDEQNREIEHLLLVTHGIGQRLGLRMETVNFIHDVNTFRKTLKAVYGQSPDLQALNSEVDKLPKNCRVQVLPINWRHRLDFPKQSLRHNRKQKEHDLGDTSFTDEDEYPNLEDLTIEGVPAVRNLITDLALDILLYTSPIYKDHISHIVVDECNRIYNLFKQRQPNFKGKVSLVGHSLGSAIFFDILCCQKDDKAVQKHSSAANRRTDSRMKLDFDVEDFYALGSPIGLFQMLQGRQICARKPFGAQKGKPGEPSSTSLAGSLKDIAGMVSAASMTESPEPSDLTTSAPKCHQIFNIFHPTDPISYRIEPLIAPAMSTLKPQPLPYTKRGIFGAQVQGLTGIGTKVGQSVSGLWSSFSTGIASSLLNRSLGISAEDETKLRNQASASAKSSGPLSVGAGTNLAAGTVPGNAITSEQSAAEKSAALDSMREQLANSKINPGEDGQHPPTLIDNELETLYAGFQRRRPSAQSDAVRDADEQAEWEEAEERAKTLKKEEAKVRALNANGRVDYSIQEGAFDISLIAAVASHLSYWADEDVSHFVISQLVSRQRIVKKPSIEKMQA